MRYTPGYYATLPLYDWGGALTGASSGYQMGSAIGSIFGPLGSKIAGGAGAVIGAFTGNKAENKRIALQKQQDAATRLAINTAREEENRLFKKQTRANDLNYLSNFDLNNTDSLLMKKGGWIGKATASIKRRGTEGVCTGSKFGSSSCPAGSKRYNLAKTFRKMAKNRVDGGEVSLKLSAKKSHRNYLNASKEQKQSMAPFGIYNPLDILVQYGIDKRIAKGYIPIKTNEFIGPMGFPANSLYNGTDGYVLKKRKNTIVKNKTNGGQVAATGITLKDGNKLLTKNGTISGLHETGQNIPLKKNGRILAYAEPGEVLVNDKDMPFTPFILSKRKGYAQQFMQLEGMKNRFNKNIIESRQADIIRANDKTSKVGITVPYGLDLNSLYNSNNILRSRFNNTNQTPFSFGFGKPYNPNNVFNSKNTPYSLNNVNVVGGTRNNKYNPIGLGNVNIVGTKSKKSWSGFRSTPENEFKVPFSGKALSEVTTKETKPNKTSTSKSNVISFNPDISSATYTVPEEEFTNVFEYKSSPRKEIVFNNPSIQTKEYAQAEYNRLNPTKGQFFKKIGNKLGKLDMNTIAGAAGTIGNLIMSNQTLKRQKGLINDSLNQALAYNPKYSKNYLLNDTIDVSDQVSAINQGYTSSISGLDGIDPAIASALKGSGNLRRISALNQVFGDRNRQQIGLRNQNVMNIMNTNNANTDLTNQTSLMKLNAKIAANEQLGDAESVRLGNVQGAIGEFNNILRDKDIMNSLKARWKDSIGTDFIKSEDSYKCGGRLRKKRRLYR